MITVQLDDGSDYEVKTLLSKGDSNAKLYKSDNANVGYLTFGLSLAPAKLSGYNVCASSSDGCRKACLNFAGLGQVKKVQTARIAKTKALFEDRINFHNMLIEEIGKAERKAKKQNKKLAVRLNVLSDIMWEETVPYIFLQYNNVQFYDYTKHYKRMLRWCRKLLPKNYHLTFSRSECNEANALDVLGCGGNVTVVFQTNKLPFRWKGYRVINGDETDLRFLDPKGVVIGLKAKGIKGRNDRSGFVVNLL